MTLMADRSMHEALVFVEPSSRVSETYERDGSTDDLSVFVR